MPAYIKWIPAPKPRGKYTVADTNLVTPVQIYPVILESSLVCWHSGSAGLIMIEKNGQVSNPFESNVNDNPLTGGAITADPIIWDMVLQYISEYGPAVGLALVVAYFGEDYVNYIINNPPQNVLGRSLPKTQANAPTLSSRPTQKEYDVWYDYYYGAETKNGEGEKKKEKPVEKPKDNQIPEVGKDDELPNQGQVDGGVEGAPPVNAGKQGKHIPEHNNAGDVKTQWSGTNGVQETQEAWLNGNDARGGTKVYDTGQVVGNHGETGVRVHQDSNGNIHGYPVDPNLY